MARKLTSTTPRSAVCSSLAVQEGPLSQTNRAAATWANSGKNSPIGLSAVPEILSQSEPRWSEIADFLNLFSLVALQPLHIIIALYNVIVQTADCAV